MKCICCNVNGNLNPNTMKEPQNNDYDSYGGREEYEYKAMNNHRPFPPNFIWIVILFLAFFSGMAWLINQ